MVYDLWFWMFLSLILVAVFQDLKRREVDNWLNFMILCLGIVFIVYLSIFDYGLYFFIGGIFVIILGFIFANLFYYGHVFAGGDAKLLLALSPFFVNLGFISTFFNFILFVLLLLIFGGFYGLSYSIVLFILNFKKSSIVIRKLLIEMRYYIFFIIGLFLIFLYFVSHLFLVFGLFFIFFPILYCFAKGLEEVVMKKEVRGCDLREGDWLVKDIIVNNRLIKANFDGLNQEDIIFLQKKKKVLIREGIPFVPSFLIAFIFYYFYSESLINILLSFF
jgi:Flp pilus assembly protein protease CpaA